MSETIFVGIDVGINKLALSKASSENYYVFPYKIIEFKSGDHDSGAKLLNEELATLLTDNISVVFGYPLNLNSTISKMAKFVDELIKSLKKINNHIKIIKQDERFSTAYAKKLYLQNHNLLNKKKKFKQQKDLVAACVILDTYLQSAQDSNYE